MVVLVSCVNAVAGAVRTAAYVKVRLVIQHSHQRVVAGTVKADDI